MSLPRQIQSRIVMHESYEGRGFTDENSLARMRMTKPDTINPTITYLMGREEKRFPLTFMTEGQKGGTKKIALNSIEYDFPVMGRLKQSDQIVRVENLDSGKTGKLGAPVYVVFKTNFIKMHHTIISPNGIQCRVQKKGEKVNGGFRYKLQLQYRSDEEYIPDNELLSGTKWSMTGGATVSASDSKGNESNVQAPGKLKNQISILRKSYTIAGNVSKKTVEFKLNTKEGETNLWMPFEEYQHDLQFKQACEEHIWWSKYNRDANGRITTIDEDTGLPIPIGAGVDDQIPNRDTYGFLTTKKLSQTVSDVMYGATDTGMMDVVLYTGLGGMEEFDAAIKRDIQGNSSSVWSTVLAGDAASKFITGAGRNLEFGAYFTQYRHIDGHVITVKHLPLLDYGGRADNAPLHPISGKPLTSYEMYFLDQSTYEGQKNIRMVHENGRSLIRGVEQGMSLLRGESYGDYKGNGINLNLATDQDRTSVHFMKTLGVVMFRNNHCFKLSCDLS
jgi:hypothetical protein